MRPPLFLHAVLNRWSLTHVLILGEHRKQKVAANMEKMPQKIAAYREAVRKSKEVSFVDSLILTPMKIRAKQKAARSGKK